MLVALAGALLAARAFPALLRLAERPAAAAGVSLRLALLSLVRNPGVAAVAVACLTVTVGMAVFALTYRPRSPRTSATPLRTQLRSTTSSSAT